MKEHLTAQQEAVENERKKLFFSAEKLEAESSKLSLEYKKNLQLQDERESRIKIQEQALIREKELFLEQTKWEREHTQVNFFFYSNIFPPKKSPFFNNPNYFHCTVCKRSMDSGTKATIATIIRRKRKIIRRKSKHRSDK